MNLHDLNTGDQVELKTMVVIDKDLNRVEMIEPMHSMKIGVNPQLSASARFITKSNPLVSFLHERGVASVLWGPYFSEAEFGQYKDAMRGCYYINMLVVPFYLLHFASIEDEVRYGGTIAKTYGQPTKRWGERREIPDVYSAKHQHHLEQRLSHEYKGMLDRIDMACGGLPGSHQMISIPVPTIPYDPNASLWGDHPVQRSLTDMLALHAIWKP